MMTSPDSDQGPVTAPPPRRAAVVFIFITVMLDMLAIGLIIPVLPGLIKSFLDGDTARASIWMAIFGTVWAVMQFAFMPVLGALSDAHGRRPVVLLSNFGLGFDYILMAAAPSLGFLLVGRVISGVTAASVTTASAYIADVTPPERRAAGFGLLGAAFGVGFVAGPALGGLLHGIGPRAPFWVAAALSLANAIYGLFVLPESLPRERRKPFAWRNATPGGAIAILRSHPGLLGLASVQFLSNLAHGVLPSVSALYVGYRYQWTEKDVGLMLATVGICSAVVQAGLVRPIVAALGERRALGLGLGCGAAAFAMYGAAPTGWLFLLAVPVMSLWGVAGASAQSLMSRKVSPSEQGRLQGALSAVQAVAGIASPLIFNGVFAAFVGPWQRLGLPGAPFLLAAVMVAIGLLQAMRVTGAMRRPAIP